MLLISNGEKFLSNVNAVVRGQVKSENSSLPVAVRVSKTFLLKLPNVKVAGGGSPGYFDNVMTKFIVYNRTDA